MRINVIGTAGTGKTTLAAALAQKLDCQHIELDAIHWGPNWTPIRGNDFRARVAAIARESEWVVDGNYSGKIRDLLWERVQTVVWLDLPLSLILWRLVRRGIQRSMSREELWESRNRESIVGQFFAHDSLLRYAVETYKRRQKQNIAAMDEPSNKHIHFVRLKTPADVEQYLDEFGPKSQ